MGYALDVTVEALLDKGLSFDEIDEVLENLEQELNVGAVNRKILDKRIKDVLTKIYMPKHLDGYCYWIEALRISYNNPKIAIMDLYQKVADVYNSKWRPVERSMRYVKEVTFHDCPLEIIEEVFGKKFLMCNSSINMVNSKFWAILLEKI